MIEGQFVILLIRSSVSVLIDVTSHLDGCDRIDIIFVLVINRETDFDLISLKSLDKQESLLSAC